MYVILDPIAPWPAIVVVALGVTALTLYAYHLRLRSASGGWKWVALGLRIATVLLCLMAALRPTLVLIQKVKQRASLIFLIDASTSTSITDERGGQSRWDAERKALDPVRETVKTLSPNLDVKFYRFDSELRDHPANDTTPPKGRETAIGTALDLVRRQATTRIAQIFLLSDGKSNSGLPPLVAAQRLRDMQTPVVAVGFGTEGAGASSRDLAVRELVARPTVFVKNELQVRGTLKVRGYPNQPIDVELLVEGKAVAKTSVKAAEGQEIVAVNDLKYTPETPGEKQLTLRVAPKEGELIESNNEYSSFVTVLKGGLNVLYLQGPHSPWELKYLVHALDAAEEIQTDSKVLRDPAQGNVGGLRDEDLAPGKYDVYILGDVPASHLTRTQNGLLAAAVEHGAGLMMLGGRSSFGSGGWANTPIGQILPVSIHPGDGQIEPEGGLKVVPDLNAPDSYVLQLGPSKAESFRIWSDLPPIAGANQLGPPKRAAIVLAIAAGARPEPILVGQEVPKGRVLAFGGETWNWARGSDENIAAHRKFWRQAILWLAHKEDQGESQVKLALDHRRLATGEKLELTATAHGPDNAPLDDVKYEATVAYLGPSGKTEPVPLFNQGTESRGTYFAGGAPGTYKVTITGSRNGKDLGRDSARFLVYQNDRELENPAADLGLLRQIAETTDGIFLAPEQLSKYLKSLNVAAFTDDARPIEHRIWDNWVFFLIFTLLLTAEWWLRKRKGWV